MDTERDANGPPFPDSGFDLVSFEEILEWLLGSHYRAELRERHPSGRWDLIPSAMAMAKLLLPDWYESRPPNERQNAEISLRNSFSDLRKRTGNVRGYLVSSITKALRLSREWSDHLEERATAWNAGSPTGSTGAESPRRYWEDTVKAAIEATIKPTGERRRSAGMASQVRHPGLVTARNNVERLTAYYNKLFGGRDGELVELDSFLSGPNPFLLLRAPAGRGKTALLVSWVDSLSARTDWEVAFVPVSRVHQTSGAAPALGLLTAQLSDYHRSNPKHLGDRALDPAELKETAAALLATPPSRAERLLVVLDGLDEAEGWELGRGFFPPPGLYGFKVVVGIREAAEQDIASCLEQWDWPLEQVTQISLRPPDKALIRDVLRRAGYAPTGEEHAWAAVEQVERLAGQDATLVRLYAQDLAEGRVTPMELTRRDPGLDEYFRQFRHDVEEHAASSEDIYYLLGLCAASKGPLSIDDCVGLRGVMEGEDRARWLPLSVRRAARRAQRFLLGSGTEQDGYTFQLATFQDVYRTRVLATDDENRRFDDAFADWGERKWAATPAAFPSYLRQHWIAHLAQADRWERARDLILAAKQSDQGLLHEWARMRFTYEGSYLGFVEDIEALGNHVLKSGSPVELLHCALLATAIKDLYVWLSPELLIGLVEIGTPEGQWTFDAAVATAMLSDWPAPLIVALAQCALRRAGGELSDDLEALLAHTWPESLQAEMLAALAPLWAGAEQARQLPKAITAIRSGGFDKAHLLALVVPHASATERPEIAREALADLKTAAHRDRKWFKDYLSLLPWLPSQEGSDALAFATAAAKSVEHLALVAASIPEQPLRAVMLSEALKQARARIEPYRATSVADVCVHLGGDEARVVAAEVLKELQSYEEGVGSRQLYFAIPGVAPHLPRETLDAVKAIRSVDDRAHCLVRMLPIMREPHSSVVQKEAETAVYSMGPIHDRHQVDERPQLLATLARHSSATAARKMLGDALAWQRRASRVGADRIRTLAAILAELPTQDRFDLAGRVCEAAGSLVRERGEADAVRAFVDLVPVCETGKRQELARKALNAVRALPAGRERITCLAELYSYVPEGEHEGILAEVRGAIQDYDRSWTWPAGCLLRVARQLPAAAQPRLVSEALAATSLSVDSAAILERALELRGKARKRVLGYAVARIEARIEFVGTFRTAGRSADDLAFANDVDGAVDGVLMLMPHVKTSERKPLLDAALDIVDEEKREDVATTFLPYFEEERHAGLIANAFARAETLSDDELWRGDPLLWALRQLDEPDHHVLLAAYPTHKAFFGVPRGFAERQRADVGATLMALHGTGRDDLCHELWNRWLLEASEGVDTEHVLYACLLAVWVPLGSKDFIKSVADLIYQSMLWSW